MYTVEYSVEAAHELRLLDRSVARPIYKKIEWLAENFEMIEPNWLRGDLAGFAKFRAGDYRVIYEPDSSRRVILVQSIGHRSGVYKR